MYLDHEKERLESASMTKEGRGSPTHGFIASLPVPRKLVPHYRAQIPCYAETVCLCSLPAQGRPGTGMNNGGSLRRNNLTIKGVFRNRFTGTLGDKVIWRMLERIGEEVGEKIVVGDGNRGAYSIGRGRGEGARHAALNALEGAMRGERLSKVLSVACLVLAHASYRPAFRCSFLLLQG
jgi:hypothetical protein